MNVGNRICCSLATMTEMSAPAKNVAELLCDLGLVLRWRTYRGVKSKQTSLHLQ
jgi:hypothetical protein